MSNSRTRLMQTVYSILKHAATPHPLYHTRQNRYEVMTCSAMAHGLVYLAVGLQWRSQDWEAFSKVPSAGIWRISDTESCTYGCIYCNIPLLLT